MKKHLLIGTLSLLLGLGLSGLPAMAADTTQPAVHAPQEPADVAAPKTDAKSGPRFMQLHESFLKRAKEGNIDLLFLGDSITEGWGTRGKAVWTKTYGKSNAANFGIGGDKTQHVLWRIDNGELDGIKPKVLVLMIGTNNSAGWSAEQIAVADTKIVTEIHQKLPETKVLLLGIFPRGNDPKDAKVEALREKLKQVNLELAKLDDGKTTRYLDIGDKFLTPDGVITKDIMADYLHPTAKGYQIWADAMQPLLDEMMK
jgi:lysophospholipase L1-like esterase